MRSQALFRTTIILLLSVLIAACSQQPSEIHYGNDECAHCKMMITDNRFAAQMVTETGKAVKFDAIECLARYAGDHKAELETAKLWVSNFNDPGKWISLDGSYIIKSEVVNSPMGESLLALENEQVMKDHLAEYPGELVTWQRLLK